MFEVEPIFASKVRIRMKMEINHCFNSCQGSKKLHVDRVCGFMDESLLYMQKVPDSITTMSPKND